MDGARSRVRRRAVDGYGMSSYWMGGGRGASDDGKKVDPSCNLLRV